MGLDSSKLLPLAALAAPVVIVQAARLFLGGGLAEAPASVVDDSGMPEQPVATRPLDTLRDEERELAEWMEARRAGLAEVRSPLEHSEAPGSEDSPSPEAPSVAGLPAMRVTGIVGSGDRGFASINGEVRRVGDELAPGWRLHAVDAREQVIEVRSAAGKSVQLRPERP